MPRKKPETIAGEISARREKLREEAAAATRERIQTTQLVEALQNFALGNEKTQNGKKAQPMSAARLKAIEMLLDKTLPNLSSVKLDMDAKPITFIIGTEFAPPAQPAPESPE